MAKQPSIFVLRKRYPFVRDIYDRTTLFLLTFIVFLGFDYWYRGPAQLRGYGYTIIVIALFWYLWRVIQYFAKLDKESFHLINASAITFSSFKPLLYIVMIILGPVGWMWVYGQFDWIEPWIVYLILAMSSLSILSGSILLLWYLRVFKLIWWICKIPIALAKFFFEKSELSISVEWDQRTKFEQLQDSVKQLDITHENLISEIRQVLAVMQNNQFVIISSNDRDTNYIQYAMIEEGIILDIPIQKSEATKKRNLIKFLHFENVYPKVTILGQLLNPGPYYTEGSWKHRGKHMGPEFQIYFGKNYTEAAAFGAKLLSALYGIKNEAGYNCVLGKLMGQD